MSMQECDAMHRYLDCNAYVTRQIAYAHVCINISSACLRKSLTNKKRERGRSRDNKQTKRHSRRNIQTDTHYKNRQRQRKTERESAIHVEM